MKTVEAVLADARRRGVDRLDAQLLLGRALGCTRTWLLAHGDTPLDDAATAWVDAALVRRAAGEPLAYLLGEKEFHGLVLQVDARVLVPRPDTEVLVDWAIELLRASKAAAPQVVDLGTGSGAIALAVAHAHPSAQVSATDLSEDALAVARGNAARLSLALRFAAGAWWQAVGGQRFDLALSNPPYIAAADAHLAALSHEPAAALCPGPTGLESLQTIVADAQAHLAPSGWLLLEHGHDQAPAVRALLERYGFMAVDTRLDLAGHPRCTGGRRGDQ